jgi:hypothetical protein
MSRAIALWRRIAGFSVLLAVAIFPAPEEIQTPAPPLSPDYFPCTGCHEKGQVNPQRRSLLNDHPDIILEHDAKNRWCLDCHAPLDRDKLHLASGELIEFGQSYRLCGQCHGPTFRDWKAGVHGKRTGMWNGKKNYFLCVHCHNPHSPAIKPIPPFPSPVPPAGKPFLFGGQKK